jgi:hypothetical protein
MLCDNCIRWVKPLVAVDIDGTLGDYHGHFIRFAELYLQRKLPHDYDGATEFSEFLGMDKETYRQIKLAYRQGGMKRCMPLHVGARGIVKWLNAHDNDVDIWVTTTRPYLRLDGIDPDTRFWLDHHGLHYHNLLYHEDKYKLLRERCDPGRVIAVVDDLREQCQAAAIHFGEGVAIQLATVYNSEDRWKDRQSPGKVPDLLSGRLAAWGEAVAIHA